MVTNKDGPYSYRVLSKSFWNVTYEILYDDTTIRIYTGSHDEVNDMVFLLNTAWSEGFNTAKIYYRG